MLRRLLHRKERTRDGVEIVSRKPSGKFMVEKSYALPAGEALVGEVREGIVYPGYKLKGRRTALIREIQANRRKIDFAVSGDRVALIVEEKMEAKEGDVLEVYPS